jgi:hypothetical protein
LARRDCAEARLIDVDDLKEGACPSRSIRDDSAPSFYLSCNLAIAAAALPDFLYLPPISLALNSMAGTLFLQNQDYTSLEARISAYLSNGCPDISGAPRSKPCHDRFS